MNANPDSKEQQYQVPLRVPPPNYVCYRCGQKGNMNRLFFFLSMKYKYSI